MFKYKCPSCGWIIKSPTIFQEKKLCPNCDSDGFVELQAAQQNAHVDLASPFCPRNDFCPYCALPKLPSQQRKPLEE